MKSTLYVMIGAPGSGKTTLAKANAEHTGAVHISRDEVRFSLITDKDNYFAKENQVYKTFTKLISDNLAAGHTVIADATHLNKKSRYKLFHNIHYNPLETTVIGIYMDIPLETCLERNDTRKGGRTFVPPHDLYNMYEHLQPPTYDEPFDYIYIFDGEKMTLMGK